MDIEEGHLLPSFALAHSLKRNSHQVIYISVPDNEDFIREQGFEFYPVLSTIYPKGFNERSKKAVRDRTIGYSAAKIRKN
jgi:UDP:flavonoid glycosyltransferase YjiC (YdhE family)